MRTPDQIKQLNSWAEERDTIMRDLTVLRSEQGRLSGENADLGSNHSDLLESIREAEKRLAIIDQKEQDRIDLVSKDILELEIRKNNLENAAALLEVTNENLTSENELMMSNLKVLLPVYDKIVFMIEGLNTSVHQTIAINKDNIVEVNGMLDHLKKTLLANQE